MNQETVEYLKNFKTLLDEGIITQDEFEAKKQTLLLNEHPQDSSPKESELKEPAGQPVQTTVQPSKRASESSVRPIDIIWTVVGAIFVLIGLIGWITGGSSVQYGADYYTDQYAISCFTAQSINMLIAAVGSIEVCIGLNGLIGKQGERNE